MKAKLPTSEYTPEARHASDGRTANCPSLPPWIREMHLTCRSCVLCELDGSSTRTQARASRLLADLPGWLRASCGDRAAPQKASWVRSEALLPDTDQQRDVVEPGRSAAVFEEGKSSGLRTPCLRADVRSGSEGTEATSPSPPSETSWSPMGVGRRTCHLLRTALPRTPAVAESIPGIGGGRPATLRGVLLEVA